MKNVGWRFYCLVPILLGLSLAEEVVSPSDLKTDINQEVGGRTGAVSDEFAETAISDTKELSKTAGVYKGQYQSLLDSERFPDKNAYEYVPKLKPNAQTTDGVFSTDLSSNQVLVSGADNQGERLASGNSNAGEVGLLNAYSRMIPHNEHILLHKIPGATDILTCSREGELHNFWSSNYDCLVCACIRDTGVLRPVCASCGGCKVPSPEPYTDIPLPLTVRPATIPPPLEEVTCRPLPRGQPFENPLHPCQVCICIESINAYGMPDVQIQCQENPQCVLPPDTPVFPTIPDDVPVHSHICEKFPPNVVFPHPSDSCKTCRCSVQLPPLGQPDKLMTCVLNPNCIPEIITEIPEPYPATPAIIPITPEPYWPPVIPPGPLPGPSPHDSCRPYVPNQPFDHPWDECQMCVCTEAFAKKHVTVEISCFTKKSCCAETPFDVISSATLAPVSYQPPGTTGNLQFQDAMCEYKTFGVEFLHPKELCVVCTCEIQGRLITPFCKRSSNPECQIIGAFPTATPTLDDLLRETNQNSLSSSTLHNEGFTGIGSNGQSGSSQFSADPTKPSYNQWNLQQFKRPGGYRSPDQNVGGQTFGDSPLVYGLQTQQKPGNQFGQNQRTPNYYPGLGYSNGQGYQGYPQGFLPSSESMAQAHAQAQSSASASASAVAATGQNSYGYAPGFQYSGGPGQAQPGLRNRIWGQQSAQSSASAQASSKTSTKSRGRSGNPDDNKPADNEN